jgi:NAD(P)-dependent dehydrogenase (short-subunit alcohol dehydrogenase family)
MELKIKDKTALVIGSTAGIGFAIAKALANEGAKVFVNGRTAARVEKAVERLKKETGNPEIRGIVADFSDAGQVRQLTDQLTAVDILINNVGVFEPKPFNDITDQDWLSFFEINVLSGIRLARAYFSQMIKNNWGRIIFISSESGIQIPEEMIH